MRKGRQYKFQNKARRTFEQRNNFTLVQKSCSLNITTDPFLWQYIHSKEKDDEATKMEIKSLVYRHVKAINR